MEFLVDGIDLTKSELSNVRAGECTGVYCGSDEGCKSWSKCKGTIEYYGCTGTNHLEEPEFLL